MNNCYYCGSPEVHRDLQISDSFTANNTVKCPQSGMMCSNCHDLMFGKLVRCLYWNENKTDKVTKAKQPGWSQLWTRNTSWLISERESYPTFSEEPETVEIKGKSVTAIVISNLPSRQQIRQWLLEPPEPPFTIAIAESGQKHIRFLAQTALHRDHFPVQFETDTLYVDRAYFTKILNAHEGLLRLGFQKTDILTGSYFGSRILQCLDEWEALEKIVQQERVTGTPTRLLQLVSHVGQKTNRQEI